jgi:hypothetical protein
MVPLALKANICTEIVVVTSLADKLFALRTIQLLGQQQKPPIVTSDELFEFMQDNNVGSLYSNKASKLFFLLIYCKHALLVPHAPRRVNSFFFATHMKTCTFHALKCPDSTVLTELFSRLDWVLQMRQRSPLVLETAGRKWRSARRSCSRQT